MCLFSTTSYENTMSRKCLILGGNGFIGYTLIKELAGRGLSIRSVDRDYPDEEIRIDSVEYYTGDIWDKTFLYNALNGIEMVYDFIATTMPNTKDVSLENEIDNTLRYHNYILSNMYESGVKYYVFPLSGGAIYGNTNKLAEEEDELMPTTPYGVGKQMTEALINYYSHRCGINAYIFRIGNVYGSSTLRKKPQGVVDIFIQRALKNEPLIIWGNAKNVIRDYIYLEDVVKIIADVTEENRLGIEVYNVGTGKGTSLEKLIKIIENEINRILVVEYKTEMASGIDSIVLSNEKLKKTIGKLDITELEDGIRNTINRKRKLLEHQK